MDALGDARQRGASGAELDELRRATKRAIGSLEAALTADSIARQIDATTKAEKRQRRLG